MSDQSEIGTTRREFVLTAAAALVASGAGSLHAQGSPLTVQALLDRMKSRVGVPWNEKSLDGLKAGSAAETVRGIATMVSPTLPLLRQAAAAGRNVIVTDDPLYYAANEDPGNRAGDPVYLAKKAFVDERRLAIVRFSDHWSARTPNEPATALASALWPKASRAGDEDIFTIPETTLGAIAALVRSRLGLRGGLRTIGPASLRVRSVLVAPGTIDLPSVVTRLPRADLLLAGEPREWEGVPYVLDARTAGQTKGLIAMGRLVSRDPGMRACADWLRSLAPEVTVESIATPDPYWSPLA